MSNVTKQIERHSYLVGGAVRDSLLGLEVSDKDYVVVQVTANKMLNLGFKPVGKDFPVFLHPKTKDEYALARTERKIGRGYSGFSVDASVDVTLEQDLARRDLTINSMALDNACNLIDPFNGKRDLENKVLRHTTEAFKEDPVRVLRLARFRARYGYEWQIADETKDLVLDMRDSSELDYLVAERIWKETEKALMEKTPQLFFETLDELGVLEVLFPEIAEMQHIPQPAQYHPEGDVYKHTLLVLKRSADYEFDLETRFAALTHDFGKAQNYKEYGHLRGHELRGVSVIDDFCARLKIPNKLKNLATLTSELHLYCHKLLELRPKTLQKLLIQRLNALKNPILFERFINACLCDTQGRGPAYEHIDYPQARFAKSLIEALSALDIRTVVKEAQRNGKEGPELGEIVRQAQIKCIKETQKEFSNSTQ